MMLKNTSPHYETCAIEQYKSLMDVKIGMMSAMILNMKTVKEIKGRLSKKSTSMKMCFKFSKMIFHTANFILKQLSQKLITLMIKLKLSAKMAQNF